MLWKCNVLFTFLTRAKSSMTSNQRRGNKAECELPVYLGLVWIPRQYFYLSVQSITSNALVTKHSICDELNIIYRPYSIQCTNAIN